MKLNKVVAIPAIALAAGIALAACGSLKAPAAASAARTVTATPKASATTAPPNATSAPTMPAPAPARTVYVPAAPAPPQPAYFSNSTGVVQQFYQDINNGDYSAAWALGGDNIGGSNEAAWAAGYDTTVSVLIGTFSAFGSDQVQASLSALQSDGATNTYEGTYTVSGDVIVAANIVQTG